MSVRCTFCKIEREIKKQTCTKRVPNQILTFALPYTVLPQTIK